jgi:anti-sigma factor RsiW
MQPDELKLDCGRVQGELASLVYGELANDARAALDRHLEGCATCRDELSAMRDTQRLLARWETPPASDDPRLLARAIAAEARGPSRTVARRARLVRWSAILFGAAAALLFTLSVLGARASVADGRCELSFHLPGFSADPPSAGPQASAALPVEYAAAVRSIAADEVATRTASFEQNQNELLEHFAQLNREELVRLAQAIDTALAQNQRVVDQRFTNLGREAARADLETRRVVTDLAAYMPVSNNR